MATQNAWLARGLDPALKSVRAANYIKALCHDLLKVAEAWGVEHPALIDTEDVEILYGHDHARPLREVYGYPPGRGLPADEDRRALVELMSGVNPEGSSAPPSPTAQR